MYPALRRVANALAEAGQPKPALDALQKAFADLVGYRLFTILLYHPPVRLVRRAFSSQPEAYPVGGTKPLTEQTPWTRQVLGRGEVFVGHDRDDIRLAFPDYKLIWSLGCESVVNLPVRWNGNVIGTCNLLHQSRWYSDCNLDQLVTLAQLAVPIMQHITE